jgi:hypothetical protein
MPPNGKSILMDHVQRKARVSEVINQNPVSYVRLWALVQQTQVEPDLYLLCHDEPDFSEIWQKIWISLGEKISPDRELFYGQSKINGFELVLGALYYLHSMECGSPAEAEEFIRIARAHHSIHAEQQVINALFQRIDASNGRSENADTFFGQTTDRLSEIEKKLKEAIDSVKLYVRFYGSYAFMMLADLYVAYAQFSFDHPEFVVTTQPSLCLAVAKRCCKEARQYLDNSREAIFNASGGRGLKTSTRFGFSDPTDFEKMIFTLKEQSKQTAENRKPSPTN